MQKILICSTKELELFCAWWPNINKNIQKYFEPNNFPAVVLFKEVEHEGYRDLEYEFVYLSDFQKK